MVILHKTSPNIKYGHDTKESIEYLQQLDTTELIKQFHLFQSLVKLERNSADILLSHN